MNDLFRSGDLVAWNDEIDAISGLPLMAMAFETLERASAG